MADSINLDSIKNTAIKYRKELLLMPIIGAMRTLQHMTPRGGVQWYEEVATLLTNDNLLVPYDGNENKKDLGNVIKRRLAVYVGSAVVPFEPETFRSTFLGGELVGNTKAGANKIPYEMQILTAIQQTISKNLNMCLFTASRDVAVKQTDKIFYGWNTIIDTEKTAGNISVAKGNMLANEAWNPAGAVELLKQMYRGSTDELQDVPVKMFVNKNFYNDYNENYKIVTGSIPYNTEYKKTFLEGTDNQCELVPLVSLKGSNRVIMTQQSNMLYAFDQMSDMEYIEVQRFEAFRLSFIVKMAFGVEFESIDSRLFLVKDFE